MLKQTAKILTIVTALTFSLPSAALSDVFTLISAANLITRLAGQPTTSEINSKVSRNRAKLIAAQLRANQSCLLLNQVKKSDFIQKMNAISKKLKTSKQKNAFTQILLKSNIIFARKSILCNSNSIKRIDKLSRVSQPPI